MLREETSSLKTLIKTLNDKLEDGEAHQHRDNLIVSELPLCMVDVVAESDNSLVESPSSIAQQVANFCTNILHYTVSDHNISVAYSLKNHGHDDNRQLAVIVRFAR